MTPQKKVTDALVGQGILPLYFHADPSVSADVLQALYQAGVRAVEYTNRGDAAYQNFQSLVALRDQRMSDMLLGVGTIKNLPDAKRYLEAGADFLVSPGLVPDVAQHAVAEGYFYAPGCMTPTEIIAAENAGITFIKLFPGNLLGPEFMSGIKEIFPRLRFMPTGGVDPTEESIGAWFKAGVSAVGMGSKLVSKSVMENKEYVGLTSKTAEVLQIVQKIKSK